MEARLAGDGGSALQTERQVTLSYHARADSTFRSTHYVEHNLRDSFVAVAVEHVTTEHVTRVTLYLKPEQVAALRAALDAPTVLPPRK